MKPNYSTITELPGAEVTKLQLDRSYNRYRFGADFCNGKEVLEVACGGGQGLGLLAAKASRVVGGDCEKSNLEYAHATYATNDKISIVDLDAHDLRFEDDSFDVILIYEAIYYLKSPEKFLSECRRVLRTGGELIVCTANKNWPDFNPSPFSHTYYSVPEMRNLFEEHGFRVEFFGGFPDDCDTFSSKLRSLIKRTVVKLNLMPRTMKGKVLFKKIFYGEMVELPRELRDGVVEYIPPKPIPDDLEDRMHTAIFAVARLA